MSQLPPSLDCRGFQTCGIFPGDLRVPCEGQFLPLLPPPLIQGNIPQKASSSLSSAAAAPGAALTSNSCLRKSQNPTVLEFSFSMGYSAMGGSCCPRQGQGHSHGNLCPVVPPRSSWYFRKTKAEKSSSVSISNPPHHCPSLSPNSLKPFQACSTLLQVGPSTRVLLTQLLLPSSLCPFHVLPCFLSASPANISLTADLISRLGILSSLPHQFCARSFQNLVSQIPQVPGTSFHV